MLVICLFQENDFDDFYVMVQNVGKGLIILLVDCELLQKKIVYIWEIFNQCCVLEVGLYLFVFEDIELKKIVGISGIQVWVGLDEVFYNYCLSIIVNVFKEFGVYVCMLILYLFNDMIDISEICLLLLLDDYKGGGSGLLLF